MACLLVAGGGSVLAEERDQGDVGGRPSLVEVGDAAEDGVGGAPQAALEVAQQQGLLGHREGHHPGPRQLHAANTGQWQCCMQPAQVNANAAGQEGVGRAGGDSWGARPPHAANTGRCRCCWAAGVGIAVGLDSCFQPTQVDASAAGQEGVGRGGRDQLWG